MIKVKICGIKTREAAIAAEQSGADFIGFVFYKDSPRFINPFKAAEIAKAVTCKKVGVFVNESAAVINGVVRLIGLDYVQLHGNEDAKFASSIRAPVIKAWRYGDNFDVREVDNYPCELALLDSFIKEHFGGTGQTFDWNKASLETRKLTKPFMIAGGISIQNVREVVEIFRPYGIDVSGSLEVNGVKSVNKIHAFMEVVHTFAKTRPAF